MLWFRLRLKIATVVSLLVVFYQRKEVECQTTGQTPTLVSTSLPLPASTTSYGRTPGPPSSSGGHPPGGILPTDGQTPSPSTGGRAPGGVQTPGIQSPTDGETPSPDLSGGHPPSPIPTGQPPAPPSGGFPPGGHPPFTFSSDGQNLGPPSGEFPPGSHPLTGQPPAPPWGGLPPGVSPPAPITDVQPPSPIRTDAQSPGPPSGGLPPGGQPPSPIPTDVQPPSPIPPDAQSPGPPSGGFPPGGQPPSPIPTDIQPPSPIPTDVQPAGPPSFTSGRGTATSSPTSLVTTGSFPSGPDPDSFLISSLRRKCSPDEAPTDDQIGPQWDSNIRDFVQREFIRHNSFPIYSCRNRCGKDERDASTAAFFRRLSRCYCDKLCDEFGDCCYDFNAICRKVVNPQRSPLSSSENCFARPNHPTGAIYHGYAVWSRCPENWKESRVRQKCQHEDQSDLLNNLPVFHEDSLVTYRNIFCAQCNGATDTTYWRLEFQCNTWFNTTASNLSTTMNFLRQKCSVITSPEEFQLRHLKLCISRFRECASVSQAKNDSYCQTECLRYAFPTCVESDNLARFRNPQCALCNGFEPRSLEIECASGSGAATPPLSVLFDFSSSSMFSVVVDDREHNMRHSFEDAWSCTHDEVYDPYTAKCRKIVSVGANHENHPLNNAVLNLNCTFVYFNKSDYERQPNGSVYIRSHNKIYSNSSYKVQGDRLLLCVNFSRNATVNKKERNVHEIKTTPASLSVLTTIGFSMSMLSLVILLLTYVVFSELRNLPGKIIINLAISLLLYQSLFFLANKTSNDMQCLVAAILLHFLTLCSFTWMNVMAYDVHRIFTASDGVASNHHADNNKRLVKYCLYAWLVPAVVVSLTVLIDRRLNEGYFGYGQGEAACFISRRQAILYAFVLPVALLMLFNIFALGHTILHIVRTRKRTTQVTNQRHSTSLTLICVKMASVMGVTWILGIAANVHALSFLWYPYVVLNSLQGFFIFLSFAASGKALELYRDKLTILTYLKGQDGKKSKSVSNSTLQSVCASDSKHRPDRCENDTRL